jgi:hypothetical protein
MRLLNFYFSVILHFQLLEGFDPSRQKLVLLNLLWYHVPHLLLT